MTNKREDGRTNHAAMHVHDILAATPLDRASS
jgi:hypothetical protein